MTLSPTGATGNVIPKGYKSGQLQQFNPEQMSLFKQLFSHVSPESNLSRLAMGDESGFAPMEERAMRDFQNFQGQSASRFSGLGTGGTRNSGFRNQQTQGAQDFASMLAEKRQGLQRQALMDLMGLSEDLLGQRPYENFLTKTQPKQSKLQKWLGIGLPIAGAAVGGAFGGPAGAALGGNLGGSLASGFTGSQGGNYEGISSLPSSWRQLGGNNYDEAQMMDNFANIARY